LAPQTYLIWPPLKLPALVHQDKDNTQQPRPHEQHLRPMSLRGNIIYPSNPAAAPSLAPLTLGIYVDNFIYFLDDPAVECQFEQLLMGMVTVEFMENIDWFLGTHFQWSCSNNDVSVHLNQTGFAAHLVKDNNVHTCNISPNATPYRSWRHHTWAQDLKGNA
jgi:hypothetical protein